MCTEAAVTCGGARFSGGSSLDTRGREEDVAGRALLGRGDDPREGAAARAQLVVGAGLDDAAVLEHRDAYEELEVTCHHVKNPLALVLRMTLTL